MGQESKRSLEEILEMEPQMLRLNRRDARKLEKKDLPAHTIELTLSASLYRSLLTMSREQAEHFATILSKAMPAGMDFEVADWSADDNVSFMYQLAMVRQYEDLCAYTDSLKNMNK